MVGIGAVVIIIGLYAISISKSSASNAESSETMSPTFSLKSSAFENGASVPSRFTCDGESASPPLSWSNIPEGTKSLALTVHDPDVPKQLKPDGMFDHWVVFNLPVGRQASLQQGEVPEDALIGANGAGQNKYTGFCPPPQYEPSEHRYFFTLYALDIELPLKAGATRTQVEQAMEGHVLGQAELLGKYKRITK